MANKNNMLEAGLNDQLRRVGQQAYFRGFALAKYDSGTFATSFTATKFPQGKNLIEESARIENQGDNPYNNFLSSDRKSKFRFDPMALGFHISDLGDNKARSILLEHSRGELWVDGTRVVNQPLVSLQPGLGVSRSIARAGGETATTLYSEQHGAPVPDGLFRLPPGIVFNEQKVVDFKVFIDPAALTALAALTGSTPAQGWAMGPVFYGHVFQAARTGI